MSVAFSIEGPASAPPVLLLHSIATSRELWLPQLAAWAGPFRLIRADLPGHGVSPLLKAGAGFEDWAVCGNGAFGIHLRSGELLFAQELPADTLRTLADALRESIPDLLFASVSDRGDVFVAQHGYAELAELADHRRDPRLMGGVSLEDVLAEPSLKLVVRHPEHAPALLYDAIRALGLTGFEVTLSGAPFVEVMAEGVTKATGLARLCEHLHIDRADVVAFGDGLKDVEMLRWAGHGVAVSNAEPAVQDAADEVTASNDDDGVAQVIERLLG